MFILTAYLAYYRCQLAIGNLASKMDLNIWKKEKEIFYYLNNQKYCQIELNFLERLLHFNWKKPMHLLGKYGVPQQVIL